MTWTSPFLKNDYEAQSTFDGGRYIASVWCDDLPNVHASVEIWVQGNYYCATNVSGLDGIPMAQIWCEAALAQLQQVAERLKI